VTQAACLPVQMITAHTHSTHPPNNLAPRNHIASLRAAQRPQSKHSLSPSG